MTKYLESTLVRVLSQRHMSQIEQPADVEVVREPLEVLSKMTDRQAGTSGIGVDSSRCEGKDARLFSSAHNAIVGFAPAQCSHSLEKNNGI